MTVERAINDVTSSDRVSNNKLSTIPLQYHAHLPRFHVPFLSKP